MSMVRILIGIGGRITDIPQPPHSYLDHEDHIPQIFILTHFIISEKIHYIDFIISSQDLNVCIGNVSIKLIVLQYLLLTIMIEYIILDFSKHCFKFWL